MAIAVEKVPRAAFIYPDDRDCSVVRAARAARRRIGHDVDVERRRADFPTGLKPFRFEDLFGPGKRVLQHLGRERRALGFQFFLPALLGHEHRIAGWRSVVAARVNAWDQNVSFEDLPVGIAERIAGANVLLADAAGPEVVRHFPAFGRLAHHLGVTNSLDGHDVVIDQQPVVAASRHTIDEPPCLDSCLLRI